MEETSRLQGSEKAIFSLKRANNYQIDIDADSLIHQLLYGKGDYMPVQATIHFPRGGNLHSLFDNDSIRTYASKRLIDTVAENTTKPFIWDYFKALRIVNGYSVKDCYNGFKPTTSASEFETRNFKNLDIIPPYIEGLKIKKIPGFCCIYNDEGLHNKCIKQADNLFSNMTTSDFLASRPPVGKGL